MGRNNEFFENFERNKYLKKLPSMQRVKTGGSLVQDNREEELLYHCCPALSCRRNLYTVILHLETTCI